MLKKYEIPHLFEIKPSRCLVYWLLLIHLLAIVGIALSGLALVLQLIFGVLVALSLTFYLRYTNTQATFKHSVLGWEQLTSEDDFCAIEILPTTFISTRFITLHFRAKNGQKNTRFICYDSLATDDYRRLLVALKINNAQ